MHSSTLFSAVLAVAAARFAAADTCSDDIEISQPTPSFDCDTVDGDVVINEDVAGEVVINKLEEIKGDFIIKNNTNIRSISSSSLEKIEGQFVLEELNSLNTIRLDSLETVDELRMVKLTQLRALTFGSEGTLEAKTVEISDTFLDDLSGLRLNTVETLDINNNRRLKNFESDLKEIKSLLKIASNGEDMKISMPKLESASEIQIENVLSFEIPLLEELGASLKLNENFFESFIAPNLTKVTDAVSFFDNEKLTNLSFPVLQEVSGDLTIIGNTELTNIDGFPELEIVLGGIKMGGNFEEVDLPSLKNVEGASNVTSTTDIEDFCEYFENLKSEDVIRGESKCWSNNKDANEGVDTTDGLDESENNESENDEGAAGMTNVNTALLGLAVMAGIAQLL